MPTLPVFDEQIMLLRKDECQQRPMLSGDGFMWSILWKVSEKVLLTASKCSSPLDSSIVDFTNVSAPVTVMLVGPVHLSAESLANYGKLIEL